MNLNSRNKNFLPQRAAPHTVQVAMNTVSTAVEWAIPVNTQQITVQLKKSVSWSASLTTESSMLATASISVSAGNSLSQSGVNSHPNSKLFLQSTTASQTAEIIYWK